MREFFVMALVCFLSLGTANAADLAPYYGTYRGIAPTDESAIVHGELEITINATEVMYRFATGHKIHTEKVATASLVPASTAEVAAQFRAGSGVTDRVVGFKYGRLIYLFFRDPKDDEHGLIIRGNEMADILGLTILYSPKQVESGLFEKWVENLKSNHGDVLPRLANDGKATAH